MRDRNDGDDGRDQGRARDDERGAERAIENKYLQKLDEPRDAFAEKRIEDMADRLSKTAGSTPDSIREALHLWRTKDPQPETHNIGDPMQMRLSEDKNLAFALLLRRAGVVPDREADAPAQAQARPQPNDDDIFAKAARGSAFKREQPENRGERPNSPDRAPERVAEPEQRPLLRASPPPPLSPRERQAVHADVLEAVARGAVQPRESGREESREDYFKRKYEELQSEPDKVRSVERDLEKLRKVAGLGDPDVAERQFEKADERFRAAGTDEERAKAFTRVMALSLLVQANRRDTKPDVPRDVMDDPKRPAVARDIAPPAVRDAAEEDTNRQRGRRAPPQPPEASELDRGDVPIRRMNDDGTFAPVRTVEVSDREIVIDELSRSVSRVRDQDAFGMKDRMRANSEEERLGESVAAEMFQAQRYWDNPDFMAEVRGAEARYEANPENADFRTLARQHELLTDDAREHNDDELHLADRIALAGLAQQQLYAQHRLEYRMAEDTVSELRAAPPWERDEVRREALALMDVEHRGERPFLDDLRFVKRELVRLQEDNEDAARVMAVLHQAHAPGVLAEEARWDPAARQRVHAEGDRLLLEDAAATDERLQRELNALRMDAVLAPDAPARAAALIRAQDVALLLEDLPSRRSLEIETGDR